MYTAGGRAEDIFKRGKNFSSPSHIIQNFLTSSPHDQKKKWKKMVNCDDNDGDDDDKETICDIIN